ncbi:luciferase domain-containing protein [Mucilaginibacter ginkgonis]|uniref:luciferase domain-containing protein n=1 Tax=Mucilaginibacter ginkgonis TaxID=2682091 RepID=UPI001FC895E9|nr:luciferase family protein [Mucilaginibacter ginkgonis]
MDWLDEIKLEVSEWDGVTVCTHKYGGIQFNKGDKELGHIHSNGLLDILLNRALKQQLKTGNRIQDHHKFKNSGWISFYLREKDDITYALKLLRLAENKITKPVE